MVMSRTEAELAVRAMKYHPQGNRSVGGGAFSLNFQTSNEEYFKKANDEILVVLQCEHISAVERFEEIFSVPGIDAVFVGPNDLARSQYSASGQPPSAERLEAVLQQILKAGKKIGVPVGLHTFTPQDAQRRMQEGWQFIAINSELRFMLDGTAAALAPIRGVASIQKIY
jgi:4-hydroxy-2-oxoheptanedioate aldolase